MKFCLLFYLFFTSLDSFLSSPIIKKNVDAVSKVQSSMKALMPKMDDYFSKMNLALEKTTEKRDEKSVTTKSTEYKSHLVEAYTNSSEKSDKKSLDNAINDRKKDLDKAKINEKIIENEFDRDSEHHVQTAVNITPISNEKLAKKSIGINSDKILIQIFSNTNTNNEQASDKESHKVNFVQKKIPDNGIPYAISKFESFNQSSNKVTPKLSQENKSLFNDLSTGLIKQNKSSIIGNNIESGLLENRYSENLEVQKSRTNAWNLKNYHKINTDNATALTTLKVELTDSKENNSHLTAKRLSSSEEILVKYHGNVYRKAKSTPSTVGLINKNEINIVRSEKSKIEKHIKKEENSSVASSTDYDEQHEKRPTKNTGETLEKIKRRENDQTAGEKKFVNHSISFAKLNYSGPKSTKAGAKLNYSGAKSSKTDAQLHESGEKSPKALAVQNDPGAKSSKVGKKQLEKESPNLFYSI